MYICNIKTVSVYFSLNYFIIDISTEIWLQKKKQPKIN